LPCATVRAKQASEQEKTSRKKAIKGEASHGRGLARTEGLEPGDALLHGYRRLLQQEKLCMLAHEACADARMK
jgi:hypothetical protein